MNKKAYIVLFMYLIISFIGVTFAWFTQPANPKGQAAILAYGDEDVDETLTVSGRDITFEVQALDESTDTYYSLDSLNDLLKVNKFVPNEFIYLKLVFTNTSTSATDVILQIAKMNTSNSEIFNYMYFGIYDTSGYPEAYKYDPVGTYVRFSDTLDDLATGYRTTLLQQLYIYPTKTTSTVDLYCYIMLNRFADNTFQDTSLNLGIFRAVL